MSDTLQEPSPKEDSSLKENKSGSFADTLRFVLLALLIVIPFRIFIAQPFVVSGGSMGPAFETGDYLIVDQITPRFKELKRGEVIVFHYPLDTSRSFIKRVIGLSGETVEIQSGVVTIKNEGYPDGFVLSEPYVLYQRDVTMTTVLKENEYFVMGDNRAGSLDSRIWGPLEERYVIGRPILRLFPFLKFSIIPLEYEKNKK